ncbi:MBL fold metallo-hydrolase [Desulfitobacterium sp.]|uniref:MBL fold metallo-hydrolase n=1 Tax=Desulfitobacterium sp. TaxID=49981 RepID=UPI002B20ECE5|nr:MBL fold metallo-hydrolase [Desulfitobacterium sp.]MEA4901410.1 MBL fold metallo-hydrolase [Desulfitobacterium sp.]
MEILQVKGNTYILDTGMTYIPFYKINNEEIILLDTGWRKEREGIVDLLMENNFKVSGIINSHAHVDHVGNNKYFRERYKCAIAMGDMEAYICRSAVNLKTYYSNASYTDIKEHYNHMVCETDIRIQNNQDRINMCGIEFRILHTPGHSPAHICTITPDNVAYIGDALISYEVMWGAKMPYAFILSEDLKSKEKLYTLECSQYIVAHKGVYSDQEITKLIADNIKFYKSRAAGVYSVIKNKITLEEIIKAACKKFNISIKTVWKYAMIERMVRSYVEYLTEIGSIKLDSTDGFLKYYKVMDNKGNVC